MKLTTEKGVFIYRISQKRGLKKEIGHEKRVLLFQMSWKGGLEIYCKKGGLTQPNVLKRGS